MATYATEKKLGVTYIYMNGYEGAKVARTKQVGRVNADYDADGNLIGMELLEALEPVVGYEHE